MNHRIEDETSNKSNERNPPKTNLHRCKSPQSIQHLRPFHIYTVSGWWRRYLSWQDALAAYATNCRTSPMYLFPTETIVLIAGYQEPLDAFCLAVCCRHTSFMLREPSFAHDFARKYSLRVSWDVLRLGLVKEDDLVEIG